MLIQTYSKNGITVVGLDLNDTTSFGPETTTVREKTEDRYVFYVHQYSSYGSLDTSNAVVKAYMGKGSVANKKIIKEILTMKSKRIILTVTVILFVVVLVVCGGMFMYSDAKDREIIFVAAQKLPPKKGDKTGEYLMVLINRKGEYFTVSREECFQHGKSFMDIKEYYSKTDYQVEGRILSSSEMKKICNDLEKIDLDSATTDSESIKKEEWSSYFKLVATVDINSKKFSEDEKRLGIELYNANDIDIVLQIDHLVDKYAIQIVNKLLEVWPINNGEKYFNREVELTEDMKDSLIR